MQVIIFRIISAIIKTYEAEGSNHVTEEGSGLYSYLFEEKVTYPSFDEV